MSESLAERVYNYLPYFAQNFVCSAYGLKEARQRFNRRFEAYTEFLSRSESWSSAEIESYQDEKLQALVRHAYETVPFYRERMDALRLTPRDIVCRDDLPKLPVLTKEDVRRNADRLVARDADRKRLVFKHTSGTTGKSLEFYLGRDAVAFQWAVWWRHRSRFGIGPGTWHVTFTGKPATPADRRKPPYWRWNYPVRQALVNMQHVTPAKIGAIMGFLNGRKFPFYSGYPSIIHALVLAAKDAGIPFVTPPDWVFTGAENVLEFQRKDIEAATGARMTDQYGFSEGCGNASHCPELRYHEDFEFGILECVDPAAAGEGRRRGAILATGFASPEFPFLRYEVGDVGVWEDPSRPCPCGRRSRVLTQIEGRMDDYVLTPEGGRVMRFDYLFKDTHRVKEAQVVQDRLGGIRIRIVRREGYGAEDERHIRDEVRHWISPALTVEFDYVAAIEREANGKFKAVKSLLPR